MTHKTITVDSPRTEPTPVRTRLRLRVNGQVHEVDLDLRDSLLDVLRGPLGLTGTKRGCDEGECGACTVLLDGQPANACLVLAAEATAYEILTIEGLAQGELHAIQQAFVEQGAVQCGFCTPGMILSAYAFLQQTRLAEPPTRDQVRQALAGNLCRCTGYRKIVDAVLVAWAALHPAEVRHG